MIKLGLIPFGVEKYVKSFNGYVHLLTMLFAVIMRFDSLREMIHANEGVPCDVRFTSTATNDSFMLAPSHQDSFVTIGYELFRLQNH